MADRRITIEAELDASGVVRGSSVLVDQFGRVISNLRQQGAVVQQETNKSTLAFERFANAPSRGISVLDALNATVLQATGGFQGLGVASTAASVGLRAVLFSAANLVSPTTIIIGGLTALAAIMAVVSSRSKEMDFNLNQNIDSLQKMAVGASDLSSVAQQNIELLRAINEVKLGDAKKELDALVLPGSNVPVSEYLENLKTLGFSSAQALVELRNIDKDLAEKFIELTAATIEFQGALEKLSLKPPPAIAADVARSSSAAEHEKSLKRKQDLLEGGLASEIAQLSTRKEYDAELLKGLELQGQMLVLQMQGVSSENEQLKIFRERLLLIEAQRIARLKTATNDAEIANINRAADIDRLQTERQIESIQKRRHAEELAFATSVASTMVGLFVGGFDTIGQRFKAMLEQMAVNFFTSQIANLLLGGGGFFGFLGSILGLKKPGVTIEENPNRYNRATVSAWESGPPQFSAMPAGGGPVTINIQALDRRSMEKAVRNELMPIILKLISGRQVAF